METLAGLPILLFPSPVELEHWVETQPTDSPGLWLKICKKSSGLVTASYAEAVEVALCHGWIDGQKQSYDDHCFLQKFTPRKPKSIWSKINVGKAEALIQCGRMKPAGLAAVEAAKRDGRWSQAYDSHRTSEIPPDFQEALERNPAAQQFYKTLNKANTYAILWGIQTAKRPDTRQARIEKFIQMLLEGRKIHP